MFWQEIADMIEVVNAVRAQFLRVGELAGGSW